MSQNVPGLPVLKFSSKHNEILLCTLHMEVRITHHLLEFMAPTTKSVGSMAAKMSSSQLLDEKE